MFGTFFIAATCPAVGAGEAFPLGSLDLAKMQQAWGTPHVDQSVEGHPLTIGGKTYATGVGTHAASVLRVKLDGRGTRFTAWAGLDEEVGDGKGTAEFRVVGDGKDLWRSGLVKTHDA